MSKIIFDEETREFSVIESQEEFGLKDFGKDHKTALINAGTTIVGSGAGAYLARRRAIAKAKAAGATDAEAKAAGRKAALKGAAVGGAAGLVAGVGGQAVAHKAKQINRGYRLRKSMNPDLSSSEALKKAIKGYKGSTREYLKDTYVQPVKNLIGKKKE